LLAAEHGANHYGFFTTPDGQAPIGGVDGGSGEMVAVSQPGTFDTLPVGVSFQAYDSKYPEQNFGPFVKTTLQRIASGWGVAYHSLANDLEGVSFSSIRSGTLEERDRWMSDQQWFIDVLLEPVFRAWMEWSLMAGAITMPNGSALPAAKRQKFMRHEWQPRRWDWVDPKADTEANILKVKAGLMSPQDLAAAMGYDFEDTLKAIARAQQLAAQYGVPLTAYDALPGAGGSSAPPENGNPPVIKAMSDKFERVFELVNGLKSDVAQRSSHQPPEITVNVESPPVRVDVTNDSDAVVRALEAHQHTLSGEFKQLREALDTMQVNINVEPTPLQVNVAAPSVTLEASVPQPQVTVVDAHPRRAIQTVERDSNDEITRTVTVYEKD
jgi:hypothetical protein